MPERPDLDYAVPILRRELASRRIDGVRVKKPVILRLALPGSPADLLVGRTFTDVTRRAHFVLFPLGDVEMVIAPMLAGRLAVQPAAQKAPGDLAMAFALDDGRELRYRDDVQMGKVYLIPAGAWSQVPGLERIGVDVLDPAAFTLDRFKAIARARRDQVKVFLMDKSALDALGNAYADEVLFEAGIHPKTWVRSLGEEELARLHRAIPEVLGRAAREIAGRAPATDEKLRDFLAVRNRHKTPCPRCGTPIRKAGVHGHDAFFCPRCQPETRKGGIVTWGKLGSAGAAAAAPEKDAGAADAERRPAEVKKRRRPQR
ncbi:MAG TPA: DNA-formamidopyrimidine glycosylase family protein [Kofleriaceae bacterium]|nr:DNA-formamidopyrimidine glycosylase family protein [Kofleriaceae bacterium]